jgi:type I restriction enzyme M protein
LAIVFNGSPLFTGDAGSGESEIRRWIIESDWLEAIVALPTEMFYNTGIATYLWILTNRKRRDRRGKVQLINATDLFVKMRKSLGNKRNELSDGNIAEIVDLYGDLTKNGRSKLLDNSDFGYHQITVERPLRLAFQVKPERIAALKEEGAFQKLATSKKKGKEAQREIEAGQVLQQQIITILESMDATVVDKKRPKFEARLAKALDKAGLNLSAPLRKAVLSVLSERDETADVCVDADGNPEPDADLRDYENVPLKEDIHAYFKREVRPHVPDAWIDESKTRIGYEIPFNRHFYKYTPPRPLEEIKAEIKTIEQDILRLLAEVTA